MCLACLLAALHATLTPSRPDGPVFVKAGMQPHPLAPTEPTLNSLSRAALERIVDLHDVSNGLHTLLELTDREMRDRLAVLVGIAAAGRRWNISRVTWEDLEHCAGRGVRVHLDKTKTDQDGVGEDHWLPASGLVTCPHRRCDRLGGADPAPHQGPTP